MSIHACSNAHIMSVTGHKSVSSLAVYQRVGSNEKIAMGDTLAKSLESESPSSTPLPVIKRNINDDCVQSSSKDVVTSSLPSAVMPSSSSATSSVVQHTKEFPDLRLENLDVFLNNSRVVMNSRLQQPLSSKCVISNLTIHYHHS